jgi:hypothetical protein
MNKKIIILILAVLVIGIIIGYLILPYITQPIGIGEEVFGSSSGISPPALP